MNEIFSTFLKIIISKLINCTVRLTQTSVRLSIINEFEMRDHCEREQREVREQL